MRYRLHYVYGLREKGTSVIRYVGCTVNLRGRLDAHCSKARSNRYAKLFRKDTWIREVEERGGEVEAVTLCVVGESSMAYHIERMLQWKYRATIFNDMVPTQDPVGDPLIAKAVACAALDYLSYAAAILNDVACEIWDPEVEQETELHRSVLVGAGHIQTMAGFLRDHLTHKTTNVPVTA